MQTPTKKTDSFYRSTLLLKFFNEIKELSSKIEAALDEIDSFKLLQFRGPTIIKNYSTYLYICIFNNSSFP